MAQNSDFGTFGRFIETPVAEMSPEMREAFDFTKNLRGLVPGPHKIWVANPKLSKTIVPTGAYFQTASDAIEGRDRDRDLRDLRAMAARRTAASSTRRSACTWVTSNRRRVRGSLVAGLPTSFDDPREQIVYELSSVLAEARVVPQRHLVPAGAGAARGRRHRRRHGPDGLVHHGLRSRSWPSTFPQTQWAWTNSQNARNGLAQSLGGRHVGAVAATRGDPHR